MIRWVFAPRPQSSARVQAMLTERGSVNSASMRQDLEGGRRTEADAILGDMLRRARGFGVETALLAAAYCHLQVHENRLASRRSGVRPRQRRRLRHVVCRPGAAVPAASARAGCRSCCRHSGDVLYSVDERVRTGTPAGGRIGAGSWRRQPGDNVVSASTVEYPLDPGYRAPPWLSTESATVGRPPGLRRRCRRSRPAARWPSARRRALLRWCRGADRGRTQAGICALTDADRASA